ncbi:ATP-dependent RNA helicase HrpA [Chitinolyticbacter meiyuanensis]|uniref:ATP-dependent RNA helicase HrpA n=1 Tax=Chitinolyticbacter meiyuanensis TaxID=682798 RepID=UPI0011E5D768|nr:ATP-dependent RNA helicase HrpA [Chitinolyticbacter meiyuanensis]
MTQTPTLAYLQQQLDLAPARQRWALERKLRTLAERLVQGKPSDRMANELQTELDAAVASIARRRERLPRPEFDDTLPVNQKRDEIAAAIAANQVVIICGETGSGKTTQLPKICLELGRGVTGLIGHTQPRRLAARSVASRIAQELKSELGQLVGYKVRFTEKSSGDSYIKLMTDGILLAETLSDRYLANYDTIIVDEAHERSLNIDFLLGYLKQLLPRRPDLKVIVTSATIDAERFSKHFDGAPVLEVSGRTYPVEVRYAPIRSGDEDDAEIEMEEAIVRETEHLWRHDGPGDVLVFLPGEREIRETAEEFRKAKLRDAEVIPLFARLSNEDQQRIFRQSNGRRVVLATNVAETSLTVPGIRYVIDGGQARINRYSPRAKVEQLLVEKISQASARQRAGRCGRVSAGVCVRLYDEDDFNNRPAFTDPEIIRSSLAAVILRMAALKLGRVDAFPFIEAPSSRLIADGYAQLRELGAVDDNDELTRTGSQLARLPVDPRLGRMLLAGHDNGCLKEILIIAAGLSVQDPRERPFEARDAASRAHARFTDEKSDFLSYLHLWAFFEEALAGNSSNRQLVNLCHEHFLSYLRLREWRDLHRQLTDIVDDLEWKPGSAAGTYEQIHKALLTGLLGNLGMKQPENDEYLGARAIKFNIFPGSGLKKARPKWIVAGEIVETSKLYGRVVAAIEPEWVERLAEHLVKKQYFDPHWEKDSAQVVASERVTLYGLPIVNRRRVHYGKINPTEARALFIREALVKFNYKSSAKFFDHNLELLLEIEELEHKARRQDIVVDEEALFAFFDALIPADVVNGAGFEAWRKKAEQAQPQLLFLSRDYVMSHSGSRVTEEQFPPFFRLAEAKLPLAYRFEPGHPLDGVTITLPLHQLNRVNHAVFDWLVPGMLREKITLLVKALPKAIRRLCVPVPEFATRMLTELERADREAPLLPQLAQAITRGVGQPVSADELDDSELPLHLKMNYRVIDDGGQELASGRDLIAIRAQLGEAAQLTFRDEADDGGIERDGITAWDFGDLPEQLTIKRQGRKLTGYPALVDEGEACAIRLFDTAHAANEAHRAGVVRLLRIELKDHVKQLEKSVPNFQQLAIQLRTLGNADMLMDDIVTAICNRAFIGDDELPRKKKAFDEQKSRAKVRLPSVRDAVVRALSEVVAEYTPITQLLAKPGPLQHELKAQLSQLVMNGFLAATDWEQLPRLPVYLKAMRVRLDKRVQNPARDTQRGGEVAALWQRWQDELARWQREGRDTAPLLPFRWMIEELRISLFAQELRTPYPISLKRLDKAWAELTRR